MPNTTTVSIVINAPGLTLGGGNVQRTIALSMSLPPTCCEADLKVIRRDLELFGNLIDDRPTEMMSLIQAVATGDESTAKTLGTKMGLGEKEFQAQGGGWLWLVGLAAAALFSQKAY